MALTATLYTIQLELSDVDRGVYESFQVRLARQPSETAEYMTTRLLAYCLEYAEGIAFTEGVAAGDEPAVLIRDLTGKVTAWVEVGKPDAARLHRGHKLAGRAAVYTHRPAARVLAGLEGQGVFRAGDIPVVELGPDLVGAIAGALTRRSQVAVSVSDRVLYVDVDGASFEGPLTTHRFG